jgi:TolA-binding protein
MGEMIHTGGDYMESSRYYAQMQKLARNKKEFSIALAGLMENYYDLGKYDSAATLADQILNTEAAPLNQVNKATLFRGKVAMAQNDNARASDEFLSTLNTAKDASGAEAQYLLGELEYKEKRYRESLDALYRLNQNFPQYQRWKDRGFLLIADNFIALGDKYQATATLNSIIAESPDKKTRDAAKTRLDALTKPTGEEENVE